MADRDVRSLNAQSQQTEAFDILIRNARILDGSGNPCALAGREPMPEVSLDKARRARPERDAKAHFAKRLANPADAARIRRDIDHEITRRGGASRIVVYDFPDGKYVEKSLDWIARDLRVTAVDTAIWMQMNGDDRHGGARMRGYSLSEVDIEHIMKQDFTATCTDGGTVASGDGVPHPRVYGTMPRKIRRYALDRKVVELPFAIRSMTSLPAQIMRLRERGWIRPGYWADLVIFDETIEDTATFTQPHQYPKGIRYVFVKGVAVVDEGKFTKALPGTVLSPALSEHSITRVDRSER